LADRQHLDKYVFGTEPYSLSVIDRGGNTDLWFGYIQDLASREATATLNDGLEVIMDTFLRTGGNGAFRLGIRIAPAANETYDLVTLLTRQQ